MDDILKLPPVIILLTLECIAIVVIAGFYVFKFFWKIRETEGIVFDFRDKPNDLAHKKAADALSKLGRVMSDKMTPEMRVEIEREEEIKEYKKLAMFGQLITPIDSPMLTPGQIKKVKDDYEFWHGVKL
jgi:hypothetical protein